MKRIAQHLLHSLPSAAVLGASIVLAAAIVVGPAPRAERLAPAAQATVPPDLQNRGSAPKRDAPPAAGKPWNADPALSNRATEHQPTRRRPTPTLSSGLTEVDIERFLELADRIDPVRASDLRALRESKPRDFERALAQNGRTILALMALEDHNPELFTFKVRELQLDVQMRDLAKRIATMQAAGAGDDANALKAQLHEVVADYIEQSLRVRTLELLMFEKKVHTVREDLQRDAKNADRLVRELYERLLAAGPNTGAETTPAR